MTRTAEQTATSAEQTETNEPGYCLKWCRLRADIPALYPDAATAWKYAHHRHKGDRYPPRGAMVYWLGGSAGYGHIAVSVGNGRIRSTDAGGAGHVATVDVGWVEAHWGLPFAGWADNVNDVVIPGVGAEMTEDDWDRMETLIRRVVWEEHMSVTQPSGEEQSKEREQILRETYQTVKRL